MTILKRQLELLHECMTYITTHPGDLDLMLSQSLLLGGPSTPVPCSPSSSEMEMGGIQVGIMAAPSSNDPLSGRF